MSNMTPPLADHAVAQLFIDAHTARTFLDEPVTGAQIESLYEMMKWAPTTMNIQPLRLIIARSDAARAQFSNISVDQTANRLRQRRSSPWSAQTQTFMTRSPKSFLTSRMLESSSSMTNGVKQLLDTKHGCNLGTS